MLRSILDTAISPELIPSQDPDSDQPGADSESIVGPYELQDFFLYYILRFGYRPEQGRIPGPARVGRQRAWRRGPT